MSMHRGHMPNANHAVRNHAHLKAWVLVMTVVVTGPMTAQSTFAQQPQPLSLQEAEDLALYNEPGQNSYLFRAAALRDEAVAGAQLPDPTMHIGMLNFPIQSGGFTTEGMTQAQLGLRQEFPAGNTRELTARKFKAQAEVMTYTADGRGRDVLRAELERSRLDDRIIDISKHHALARAALSESVGGEADRPVLGALPTWTAVPPLEPML